MTKSRFHEVFEAFAHQTHLLSHEWENLSEEDVEAQILNQDITYPFHKDFVELSYNIRAWYDHFTEEVNKSNHKPLEIAACAVCISPDETFEFEWFYKALIREDSVDIWEECMMRSSISREEFKKKFVVIPEALYEAYMEANGLGEDTEPYKVEACRYIQEVRQDA